MVVEKYYLKRKLRNTKLGLSFNNDYSDSIRSKNRSSEEKTKISMNSESTIESHKSDGIEDIIDSGDNEDISVDSNFYLADATCMHVLKYY